MRGRTDPFEWSGGHPALDFVNTLDERPFDPPIETLMRYRDLVWFAELAGLIERPTAARLRDGAGRASIRVVAQALDLREQLYRVLAAGQARRPPDADDLAAIGTAIVAAHAARTIVVPGS